MAWDIDRCTLTADWLERRSGSETSIVVSDRPFTDDYADLLRYLYLGQ